MASMATMEILGLISSLTKLAHSNRYGNTMETLWKRPRFDIFGGIFAVLGLSGGFIFRLTSQYKRARKESRRFFRASGKDFTRNRDCETYNRRPA